MTQCAEIAGEALWGFPGVCALAFVSELLKRFIPICGANNGAAVFTRSIS